MQNNFDEKIIKTEKGAIMTLAALLLPVLLAFTGIAYDLGHLYMEKSRLQNIADAAVLAGLAELEKVENLGGTGKLVTSMPIGATTDYTPGDRSPLKIANSGAAPYLEKNAMGLDITSNSNIFYIKSTNRDEKYYYEVIVQKSFPLYFASIIHPDPIIVRAGALAELYHPFDESQLSALERWGKLGKEELYNAEANPKDVVENEIRLAEDRKSLITMADYFLGKTKDEIATKLGMSIDNNHFYGTTDGSQNPEKAGNVKDKKYSTMLVEYFDTGTTGTKIFYNENHISSQWLTGDYSNTNGKTWNNNNRYFYSDQMIQTNPYNDGTYTYSNKIKTQFKTETDANGQEVVTEVRIFVLRQKTDLNSSNTGVSKWYTNVATDRELVAELDITIKKSDLGNLIAYLTEDNTSINVQTGQTTTNP